MKKSIATTFANLFNSVQVMVPFCTQWANGTGYLDHAIRKDFGLFAGYGGAVKFIDDHGRKGIIVNDTNGSIVIFQRYTNNSSILVKNIAPATASFKQLFENGAVTEEQLVAFEAMIDNSPDVVSNAKNAVVQFCKRDDVTLLDIPFEEMETKTTGVVSELIPTNTQPAVTESEPFYKRNSFWSTAAAVGMGVGIAYAVKSGHLSLGMFKRAEMPIVGE